MSLPRAVSLSLVTCVAVVWASALFLAGLWLLFSVPGRLPALSAPCQVGGWAAIAAGQFVFMVLVADRLFPLVGRRPMTWVVEMACFLIFLGGAAYVAVAYGGALL